MVHEFTVLCGTWTGPEVALYRYVSQHKVRFILYLPAILNCQVAGDEQSLKLKTNKTAIVQERKVNHISLEL